MTITERVQKQFFAADKPSVKRPTVIRLPPTVVVKYNAEDKITQTRTNSDDDDTESKPKNRRTNLWSVEEHNRFLHGLELYPQGPWKCVAAVVGTKTTRQTMTHAQKYRQKIERRAKNEETYAPVIEQAKHRWMYEHQPDHHYERRPDHQYTQRPTRIYLPPISKREV